MLSKKLSIIILNYKSAHLLEACLVSIFSKIIPLVDAEVILVNNDKDEDLEEVSQKYPQVVFLRTGENLGFGRGNNLGARKASGELFLFLNPDTKIVSDNVRLVLEEFRFNSQVGIIGSKLLDFSGKTQPWNCGREVNLLNLLLNNLRISPSQRLWKKRKKTKVAWVSGAALFIPKELFWRIGGFDEQFFLYFEDVDLCRRVREAGRQVFYFPDFFVGHYCGGSQTNSAAQKKHYYDSQEYYFQKYYGKVSTWILKIARRFFF